MHTALFFPGYGTQRVGMVKDFYNESRAVQELFETASHCLDINFVKLCFASSDAQLARVQNAFPALFLMHASAACYLREQGINYDVVAGCGVGAYSAAYAAGSLALADGLYLLSKLVKFYRETIDTDVWGKVRIDGLSSSQLESCQVVASGDARVVITLSSTSHILICKLTAYMSLRQTSLSYNNKAILTDLGVESGQHDSLLQDASSSFVQYFNKVDFRAPNKKYVSELTGRALKTATAVRAAIINQVTHPLRWDSIVRKVEQADRLLVVGSLPSYIQERAQTYSITTSRDVYALRPASAATVDTQQQIF